MARCRAASSHRTRRSLQGRSLRATFCRPTVGALDESPHSSSRPSGPRSRARRRLPQPRADNVGAQYVFSTVTIRARLAHDSEVRIKSCMISDGPGIAVRSVNGRSQKAASAALLVTPGLRDFFGSAHFFRNCGGGLLLEESEPVNT